MFRFVDNAKMRWKFLGCVGLVLALLAVVSAFAVHQLSVIGDQAAMVTEVEVPAMQRGAALDTKISDVEVAVLRHVASSDEAEMKESDALRTRLAGEVTQDIAEIDGIVGDHASPQWASARDMWTRVVPALDEVVAKSNAGDDAGAYAEMVTKVDTSLLVLQRDLRAVIEQDKASVAAAGAAIHREHDSARTLLLVAVALALLIGALSSWFVAQRIVQRLSRTADAVRLLAEGDLRARPDVEGDDELGDMARSLSAAMDRTQTVVAEMGNQAQTLAAAAEELSAVST